jgi:hypothetical protein
MFADDIGLAGHIRDRSRLIESTKVSVTKWNPIGDLIAEAGDTDSSDVYVTTVSKPANVGVRLEQSGKARNAPIVVIMYTGANAELERCVQAAAKRCANRRMLLVFADDAEGDKTLAAIVKPSDEAIPVDIAGAYPSASVVDC